MDAGIDSIYEVGYARRKIVMRSFVLACAFCLASVSAYANPVGGVVSGGSASIVTGASTVDVNQTSDRAVIDWRSFNIAAQETTAFHQPSASSVALNRVNSLDPSQIFGTLTANGNLVLINPNGVFFGAGSRIDVNGIVASTANISNQSFMAGGMNFNIPGNPEASVINNGTITAQQAGLVGLVAPNVINNGVISARLGRVALASGDTFTVDLYGDGLIEVGLSDAVSHQVVSNTGSIVAAGGTIQMTAAAGSSIVNSLISVGGELNAQTAAQKNGQIIISAEGSNAVTGNVTANKGIKTGNSTVLVSGTLDASGKNAGETGGLIEVLGDNVGLLNGSLLDASGDAGGGTIRAGGDYHGAGDTPTALHSIMQSGATMDASAITSGNGGNVTLWADDWTTFAGDILAKGGAVSGNGGFVETSGKQTLTAIGAVDASAANGTGGTWLLDPNNITISTGANFAETGDPSFVSTDDNSVVNTTSIQNDLNNGTNVTITTASAGANTQLGDITVSNTITKSAGTDATLTLSAANNIIVNAAISSTSGKLGVVLDADSDASGSGAITVAAPITSNGGSITMGGGAVPTTTAAVGDATNIIGVLINNATVDAGGGNISIRGTGFNTTTDSNVGVQVTGASGKVQTNGSGTVTILGTGAGNTNSGSDYGVEVDTGGVVSTMNGALSVTGNSGAAGTGASNFGVWVTGANSTIETTGAGTVSVTGTGSASTGGGNYGVMVQSVAHGIQATGNGGVIINGTAGASSGGLGRGVYLFFSSITGNGGAMSITGTGGNGSGNGNLGIYVNGAGAVISNTGSGTVTIVGTGAGNTNSGSDVGVRVDPGGLISTVDGTLSVTGNGGGAGSGANNWGVEVAGANSAIETTGSGTLSVTGTGGGAGSGGTNYGVYVLGANSTIEAAGSGTVSVTGTGGNANGTGASNYGVYVHAADGIQAIGNGAVTVKGTGGATSGGSGFGVVVDAAHAIQAIGSGIVTINGTGGATGGNNRGVYLNGPGTITASGGAMSITGTGGNGTGNNNQGVLVGGVGAAITNTGSGAITIVGIGHGITNSGTDYGVDLDPGGVISAVDGAINISGTGGGAGAGINSYGLFINGNITSTGMGAITLNSIYGAGVANSALFDNGANTIGGASATGNITLNQDTATWGSLAINTSGAVTFAPTTPAGTTIGVAGAAGTLGITTTILGAVTRESQFIIGNSADKGALTVNGFAWSVPLTLYGDDGGININGAQAMGVNTFLARTYGVGDITLSTSGSVTSSAADNAITVASSHNIINDAGSSALSASTGRWLVYSTNPVNDVIGGLSNDFRRFTCAYGGTCPSFPGTGNGLLYSFTPLLTVTPNAVSGSIMFGQTAPSLVGYAYGVSGYLGSDAASDSISGSLTGSTTYPSNRHSGFYNISYASGALTSALGYGFSYATNDSGFTVTPGLSNTVAVALTRTTPSPAMEEPVQVSADASSSQEGDRHPVIQDHENNASQTNGRPAGTGVPDLIEIDPELQKMLNVGM